MNILFVCTGNVSRSFMAEMLLKDEINKHGLKDILVSSAGLHAYPGSSGDPNVIDFLSSNKISIEDHESSQLTENELDWADLVLVMEKYHLETIESQWPESIDKVKLLGEYIPGNPVTDDILDPYGKSPYHYRVIQSQISLAVKDLLKKITSDQY
jgi:protein-tyrosine phosphatase